MYTWIYLYNSTLKNYTYKDSDTESLNVSRSHDKYKLENLMKDYPFASPSFSFNIIFVTLFCLCLFLLFSRCYVLDGSFQINK